MADMDTQVPVDTQQDFGGDAPNAPVESPSAETAPVHNERAPTAPDIDAVAKRIRQESYEKGKRDALAEQQRQVQAQAPSTTYSETPQRQQSMGGMIQMSQEQLNALIDQRSIQATNELRQRESQMAVAQQVANEFVSKMQQGQSSHPDFDEVVGNTFGDFGEFTEIAQFANGLDNTADVIYALAQNPSKIGSILSLMQRSPRLALADMQSLSRSIKANEAGMAQPVARSPLSQVQPSPAGLGSGDTVTGHEDWLRV